MKTMKKVATILFALLLVLSTMTIGVNAAGETGKVDIKITADKTTNLYPGDIVTFTINIKNNFNYTAMRWPVMYTLKAFEPVVMNDGYGDTDYCNVKGFGALAGAESILESGELPTSSSAFGGTFAKTTYNGILIQWTAGTTSTGLAYYNEPTGSDCITFQLRVLDNPGVTKATVTIPTTTQAKGFFYYQAVADPADASTAYKMTSTTCTVTCNGLTSLSLFKEQAGLVPKSGTPTVIDEDGYIYGLNAFAEGSVDELDKDKMMEFVSTTGGATFTLDLNDYGCYSTGSVLTLYDASGVKIKEYQIVIFGDINGDSMFDTQDATALMSAYMYIEEWSWGDLKDNATFFACDINGDGMVFMDDYGPMSATFNGTYYLNQTHDYENILIAR